MTDEIFISEKTGKRYKWIGGYDNIIELGFITEIIEPKLAFNDWVKKESCYDDEVYIVKFPYSWDIKNLIEIRKANGEIWVKENNEWRQKK